MLPQTWNDHSPERSAPAFSVEMAFKRKQMDTGSD